MVLGHNPQAQHLKPNPALNNPKPKRSQAEGHGLEAISG